MPDQQVLRLDITVDDVLRVAVAEGVCHLLHVLGGAPFTAEKRIEKALHQGRVGTRTEQASLTQDGNGKLHDQASSIRYRYLKAVYSLCLFTQHPNRTALNRCHPSSGAAAMW